MVNTRGGLIFLVGARASGKTSVGRLLAGDLAFDFVDTDAWLQEKHQRSVAEIVASEGWACFRALEGEALRAAGLADHGRGRVVAAGGGMVLAEANVAFMRAGGLVFHLAAPAAVLAARLAAAPETAQRPSLTGRPLLEEVEAVLAERADLYRRAAHKVIDASLPLAGVAAAIKRHLAGPDALTASRPNMRTP